MQIRWHCSDGHGESEVSEEDETLAGFVVQNGQRDEDAESQSSSCAMSLSDYGPVRFVSGDPGGSSSTQGTPSETSENPWLFARTQYPILMGYCNHRNSVITGKVENI